VERQRQKSLARELVKALLLKSAVRSRDTATEEGGLDCRPVAAGATSEKPDARLEGRANGSTKLYDRPQRTTTVQLCKTAHGTRDVMAEGNDDMST